MLELTLAPASQVVKGSVPTKLKYKLTNIQLEYEMIRSETLAGSARSVYCAGKEFMYDHVMRAEVVTIAKATETRINLRVNPQRRSLKGILLLFVEPYVAGARYSEKYFNPDLTKVNGSPNMHAVQQRHRRQGHVGDGPSLLSTDKNMNLTKFYSDDKFGLLVDEHIRAAIRFCAILI